MVPGEAVAINCSDLSPARFINATLDRCLQRCRDDASSSCLWVGFNELSQQCAIGVNKDGCNGAGWALHSVPPSSSICKYGLGRAVGSTTATATCDLCPAGTASHANVGDLADTWDLYLDDSDSRQGVLTVTSSGQASFDDPDLGVLVGQFVLWNTRPDMNYPGAFFIEYHRKSTPSAGPQAWDYAWLEDTINGGRLIIRRFCNSNGGDCSASQISPEGSPFFQFTEVGFRSSGRNSSAASCNLLEDFSIDHVVSAACCDAATMVARSLNDAKFVGTFDAGPAGRWQSLPMAPAVWNAKPPYYTLQNVSLLVNRIDLTLCDKQSAKKIMANQNGSFALFARRGHCSFLMKAEVAVEAGAVALIVANSYEFQMPDYLIGPADQGQDGVNPLIPVWMLSATSGDEVLAALQSLPDGNVTLNGVGKSTILSRDDVGLRRLCCWSSCRTSIEQASTRNDSRGRDILSVCEALNCSAYAQLPPPARHVVSLPGANRPVCVICPEGSVAEVLGLANCKPCADHFVPNDAKTECISPVVPTPTATSAPVLTSTAAQALTSDKGMDSTFDWTAFFGIICCVLVVCMSCYFLRRCMIASKRRREHGVSRPSAHAFLARVTGSSTGGTFSNVFGGSKEEAHVRYDMGAIGGGDGEHEPNAEVDMVAEIEEAYPDSAPSAWYTGAGGTTDSYNASPANRYGFVGPSELSAEAANRAARTGVGF